QRVALLVVEDRDRQAPGALARDAPVGARVDHAADAVLAPVGDEIGFVDGFLRESAERSSAAKWLVHRDEPLFRRAKDDRLFAAPVVRVAVGDLLFTEQHALVAE